MSVTVQVHPARTRTQIPLCRAGEHASFRTGPGEAAAPIALRPAKDPRSAPRGERLGAPTNPFEPSERDEGLMMFGAHLLDEIDYGAFTVAAGGRLLTMNRAARAAITSEGPLHVFDGVLQAAPAANARALDAAIAGAVRGLRRLLVLHAAPTSLVVSVVPLAVGTESRVLVMLGKSSRCARLSVVLFARAHQLTSAEQRVLEALYEGLTPQQVATRFDVRLSTVRTQIGAIRSKTCAQSISELLRQVSALPPVMMVA